tara:strand:+ start:1620 stop:1988 length:369 start_codon:yes stop_codon:yes gene_type:complete
MRWLIVAPLKGDHLPRKAPTTVIEQRVTLGTAERQALLPILTDVQKFTRSANIARQVAVYGALGLGAAGLYIVPKIWSETSERIAGVAAAINPLSFPERFVDYFEERNVPTGIIGDFIKKRL